MKFENTLEFAHSLDIQDPLKNFRDQFYVPILHGKESIYFTGNSLGLQPKAAQDMVFNEMQDWANFGSEMRMSGKNPWGDYYESFAKRMANILGTLPEEVIVMNQLTANIHLLLTSFYRPSGRRNKIIYEEHAFPSDVYAMQSHVRLAGLLEEEAMVQIKCRDGESFICTEDIICAINECGDELALVFLGGVNYYTGQVFKMKEITEAAQKVGAKCGFDLAHAAGHVDLQLHKWNVDFAVWCSYKYLNSGPGAVGGAFINNKYVTDTNLPRLAGGWGMNKHSRIKNLPTFDAEPTAEGWQLSGPPVLSMSILKSSLDIFEAAGLDVVVEKSKRLGAYLQFVLNEINKNDFKILTPQNEREFGCQVSIKVFKNGEHILDILKKNSVIADWKYSGVIRIAPTALYNSFQEIFVFGEILKNAFQQNKPKTINQ
ncbi:MAG: kynureninase [Ginsengibacter sp.]